MSKYTRLVFYLHYIVPESENNMKVGNFYFLLSIDRTDPASFESNTTSISPQTGSLHSPCYTGFCIFIYICSLFAIVR